MANSRVYPVFGIYPVIAVILSILLKGLFMTELQTIKENYIFRRLYRSKKCYVYPQVVVYVAKNKLGCFRYGITTSKKVGNAVARSRSRRVIRAALAKYAGEVRDGFDVVFVARARTAHIKSTELEAPILESFLRSGAILPADNNVKNKN